MAEELDVEAMLEAPYRKVVGDGRVLVLVRWLETVDVWCSGVGQVVGDGRSLVLVRWLETVDVLVLVRWLETEDSRNQSPNGEEERPKRRRQSKSKSPVRKEKSPIRQPSDNLSPEERDIRTVFCMQLAARIRPRDLEDFFSAVGKVSGRTNSRKSKGIAYIEFVEASSVPLAIGLTGQRLLGVPIIVQASQIETIQLMMDKCAQKAVDQLDGFELAGRPMKVSHVTERSDNDDMQLMARLAEGQHALQMSGAFAIGAMAAVTAAMNPLNMNPLLPAQPLATHCFQLSHMFNSCSGEIPGWETDIQHDVIEECRKHGGVVHIYIDKKSAEGNVYVKCPTVQSAMAAVNSLHGRYFAGQLITASFVPLSAYHQLFPESAYATHLLAPPPRR
ncbi:RNA-binding protein 39 [Dissostichus eleginoides]|uniref:RNA-binding protein 39 n=1 Tax=Dissostichus eleginoides TaxID=100907 RepID=A0AAD9CGX7_DISEL|nr:RNA-binding protein 39 [Dissostichus eleginoides]